MINISQNKRKTKIRRHRKIRQKIQGDAQCPRLCVFRSLKHIYAQIIDDQIGRTLVSARDEEIKAKSKTKESETKVNLKAFAVGELIAQKALQQGIKTVVFDRGGYKYHGRVKDLAEGARAGGLNF
ncbi:MAG: 50S ribosomal protein L18 [Patescibacteria group bacterium]|jgi:large subunit ribosomal protein L18|nr:50S ribosomal protein L18 [Patescibacteria group bacterium]